MGAPPAEPRFATKFRSGAAANAALFYFQNSSLDFLLIFSNIGRRGREAVVDPEITRREVVARVMSGEYRNISFVHEVAGSSVEDITSDILAEATPPEIEPEEIDLQAARLDHLRDLRKHSVGEEEILNGSGNLLRD